MSPFVRSELDILLWIQNNVRCGLLNWLKYFTRLQDAGILVILITVAMLIFKKTRRKGVYTAAALAVAVIVVNIAIKPLVARIRPYELEPAIDLLVKKEHDFSFPSGHTNASFAFAWALYRGSRRGHKGFAILALALSVLMGLSRLYVGVHYPTDVLAGVVTGIVSAEIGYRAARAILRRIPRATRVKLGLEKPRRKKQVRG